MVRWLSASWNCSQQGLLVILSNQTQVLLYLRKAKQQFTPKQFGWINNPANSTVTRKKIPFFRFWGKLSFLVTLLISYILCGLYHCISVSLFQSLFPCLSLVLSPLLWINGFHQPNPSYWHDCALRVTEHWSEKNHPPTSAWDINRTVTFTHHIAFTVTVVSCIILALL